jgi:MFS transporter, DHA1 family, solute carrier family 18 (vesicular amine transporter), member 1/2
LFTFVVPIIPEYLFEIEHPNAANEQIEYLKNHSYYLNESECLKFTDKERERYNKTIKSLLEKWKNDQMGELNTETGLMLASKPIVQMIANPFIGPLTNRLLYNYENIWKIIY